MDSNKSVLTVVKNHLEDSVLFSNEEYIPKGGLFIKPKPKNIRVDVIVLNLLVSIPNNDKGTLEGVMNINIQHEDTDRIDLLTGIITDVVDSAFTNGYLFSIPETPKLYRLSRTLYMKNVRVYFER